jgi:trans-aconitate methyltransferase
VRSMSTIMNEYGTDKDQHHRYAATYELLFPAADELLTGKVGRLQVTHVLEVGIADGRSMLAWREIFPAALIVGMDREPCSCERGPRLEFHQGDQRSRADCLRAAGGRKFDLIVEDASHQLDANLLTLFFLWPWVKPGGCYVIEEMQDVQNYREECEGLFRGCRWTPTPGPYGGNEPLVILKKPQ